VISPPVTPAGFKWRPELPDLVYHFTDTVRLPWIIRSGELRPDTNRIGGFPQDFLWATTSERGDRTSSSMSGDSVRAYREEVLQLVRFTLDPADFSDWREIVSQSPDWRMDQILALEKAAAASGERDADRRWRCRIAPLPIARAISVHAKSYVSGKWSEISATSEFCIMPGGNPQTRGFVVNGYAYCATRVVTPQGQASYRDLCRLGVNRAT
jgi:hypothetical protein